ncbi:MAG: hypothetical protein Q9M18_08985 [Mariprofundaceae bacterium]|nr:hypothetical protein [Mariprofundaceae bacterium]
MVSASCISTAEAEAAIHVAPVTAHCHQVMMNDAHASKTGVHHVACSHCDTPEYVVSAHSSLMFDSVTPVLLAIILLPQVSNRPLLQHIATTEEDYAPPRSTTLLYHTTRRILI